METIIQKASAILANSSYAVALTGAGISTESGIPDFRGPDGVWTKNPEAEKRAYETYGAFVQDPLAYWEKRLENPFSHRYLSMDPNAGHYALATLEEMDVLKAILTQNIDNLHLKAGSKNVLEYHGNANKLRCISCLARYDWDEFPLEEMKKQNKLPPRCTKCGQALKSDVVYFQEPIPNDVIYKSMLEAQRCDVMLICGTSAAVYPFASLPRTAKNRPGVCIIEINAEPTQLTRDHISDFLIMGKTGEILPNIVHEIKKLTGHR